MRLKTTLIERSVTFTARMVSCILRVCVFFFYKFAYIQVIHACIPYKFSYLCMHIYIYRNYVRVKLCDFSFNFSFKSFICTIVHKELY